jgi:hypothetical protein
MGEHVSSLPLTITIWVLAFGVLAINIYLVVLRIGAGQPWWVYVVTTVVGVIYLAFSYSLVQEDIENGAWAVVEGLPVGWPLKRRLLAWRERRKVRKEGLIGGDGISNVSPKHQRLIESVGDSDGSEPEST